MVDNYVDMLAAARANIKVSFQEMQRGRILQVIDTIIGTKANQASSSGINAAPTEQTNGGMQIG